MAKIGNETKLFLKLVLERAGLYEREINIILETKKKDMSQEEVSNYQWRIHGINVVREIIGELIEELEKG